MSKDSDLIHVGEPKNPGDPVIAPIYQSAIYRNGAPDSEIRYLRLSNTPAQTGLREKVAALEGAESALVLASGMAAISTSLLSVIPPGGKILVQESLYGGAYYFFKSAFPDFGRRVQFFSFEDPISSLFQEDVAAIYLESISNPIMMVPDFEIYLKAAKEQGALAIIDNTLLGPLFFRPLEIGFDLVLHSATKYMNGHSDIVAGTVAGSRDNIALIENLAMQLGSSLDPNSCFLLQRGLKTMSVRMARQNETALALARTLEESPRVSRVNYPGLTSSPYRSMAEKYFGGCGGLLSFEFEGSSEELEERLSRVRLAASAPSLGGVETLILRPATTSHRKMSAAELKQLQITDKLVRVSVGIEDTQDLVQDFREAFF